MNSLNTPFQEFYRLMRVCAQIAESEMMATAKEQQRLEAYKEKNPGNVLQINSWQETINSRYTNMEAFLEAFTTRLPELFEQERKNKFVHGQNYERNRQGGGLVRHYRNENEKEAARHYSIAQQRIIDNI